MRHRRPWTEADLPALREAEDNCPTGAIDITDSAKVEGLMKDVVARYGRLDVLCNNDGIMRREDRRPGLALELSGSRQRERRRSAGAGQRARRGRPRRADGGPRQRSLHRLHDQPAARPGPGGSRLHDRLLLRGTRPDRLTVLGIGDGGTMMTLGDLETLVRYRLPAVVAVLNDRSYGAERHFLQLVGFPDAESEFQTVDFASVARSLGAAAHTIRTPDEVRALRGEIASLSGPLVLDCIINPDIRAGWLEELFQVPGHHGEARLV